MSTDPITAAPAATAPAPQGPPPTSVTSPRANETVVVNTPTGGELELLPGRQVVARVVEVGDQNTAKISLAGQTLTVQTDSRLRVGDTIQLSIERADSAQVRLSIVPPPAMSGSGSAGSGTTPQGSGSTAQAVIGALAKAGVPVTPELARSITAVAAQLTGSATATAGTLVAGGHDAAAALAAVHSELAGAATGGGAASQSATAAIALHTDSATRALATLAGRDVALSPAAAGRVAAALDVAGSLGPSLASLAARSPAVAAAVPAGPPSADSVRALLTPALEPAELAIARIVQASTPAATSAVTSSNPQTAAIRSYVSSTLALDQATTATDQARSTVAVPLPTASVSTSDAEASAATSAARGGLAGAATQAALRGQAAAIIAGAATPTEVAAGRAQAGSGAAPSAALEAAPEPASAALSQAPTLSSAKANATAAAATGAATAVATPTSERVAQAVADLGALAARVAVEAPASGAANAAAAHANRGVNATEVAQQRGADGSIAAASASNAGAAASGDPAPMVHALQRFLASPRSEGDTAQLMRAISASTPGALQQAVQRLPESQSLQLAGALLDQLPSSDQLSGGRLASLRAGVHEVLQDLGRALQPPADHDVATLRHVLHQVATTDPRPAVAHDAAQLLHAMDGQQIMSRTASGADPGYLYFQVPLPDGRGAEVMVRRDAARRDVTFEEFNIAFLLNTERLGTLMIQLDAQPSGIRADIKTDAAGLGDLLQVHADALAEPLAAAARRPVTVTTGLFDAATPKSLLDLQPLAQVEPGGTSLYA